MSETWSISIQKTIALTVHCCWSCKRHYAIETGGPSAGCPHCTDGYWRNAQEHGHKLQKSISSLRGVITRLKRGKRGAR